MIEPRPERVEFLELAFDAIDAAEASRRVSELSRSNSFAFVVTPNVDHIVQLRKGSDQGLAEAYYSATLSLCDSRILASLAALSGVELLVVPGSDLTRDLLAKELPDCRIAVVGGDPSLHERLEVLYPRFSWSFHIPPMGVRRNPYARDAIAAFVETLRPDVILFAIGAPQSELICSEIAAGHRARGVALCIGASLEFLTGTKKRAPRWMQRARLEWFYRLMSEPRRLWRRYLVDGPRIFAIWWRWHRAKSIRARSGSTPTGAD